MGILNYLLRTTGFRVQMRTLGQVQVSVISGLGTSLTSGQLTAYGSVS